MALAGAWAALALAAGGSDTGVLPGGQGLRGPTAALIASVVLAGLAGASLGSRRLAAAIRSPMGLMAVGGAGVLALWSALSIVWAGGPALAWIETNRLVMYALCLLVVTAAARPGAGRARGPAAATVVLSLAAVPVVAWALLGKVVPQIAGEAAGGRLQGPLPSFNAMALVAVMALPGALFAGVRAGRHGLPRWAGPAAAAWTTVLLVTIVLTYSRSGLLAAIAAIAVTAAMEPQRERMMVVLATALACAAPAVAYGLTADDLTRDGVPVADRLPEGPILGLALAVGAVTAALLWLLGSRWLQLLTAQRRRQVAWGIGGGLLAAVIAAGALGVRRLGSDEGVGNDASRIVSGSFNNRLDWWGEALSGFAERPLLGHGAGSFPLVHLAERDNAIVVRQPHQALLQQLAELGVVGALAWLAIAVGLVWAGVRVARRLGSGAAGPGLGVLAAFYVNAQLDWAWSIPATVLAPLAIGGILLGSSVTPTGRARRAPAALGVGLAAVVVASAALPWASTVLSDRAFDRVAGEPAAAADDARLAADLNPLDSRPLRTIAIAAKLRGDRAGRLLAADESARREPGSAFALTCQATALGAGTPGAAVVEAELARLISVNPRALYGEAAC